ncbi:hypothetical protein jhhlp_006875 [Lomentospora prolificans]|uniref:Pre-mRNA-splicing factor n=1 Tax=Lomentospora prolificans TaxID=41688 RepID=A0A2N3N2Z6_9PEZI|nr:hypothetical protein jhhlp_006875 [Lomentospora prolificans]
MPKPKRLKGSAAASAKKKAVIVEAPADDAKVTTATRAPADAQHDNPWAPVARKHWLKPSKSAKVKVKNDVVKGELWDVLEGEGLRYSSVLALENVQALEGYLWPGFGEESSNHHVLLMVLLVNAKKREQLETWSIFEDRPDDFSIFFRRVLSMLLDQTLSSKVRTQLLCFLIYSFQNLDSLIVRKECVPLVTISIWHNLSTEELRDAKLAQYSPLKKAWRASLKRYDAADDAAKARLRFERSWLFTLVLDYLRLAYTEPSSEDDVAYCERFTEFLADLQSQLPTRRYVNTLLQDLHLMPAIRLSPMYNDEDNSLLRDLFSLLSHYTFFPIDDHTFAPYNHTEAYERHCTSLRQLQRIAMKTFESKLKLLALSNFAAISQRDELAPLLEPLTDEEIVEFAKQLQLRVAYPGPQIFEVDRAFLMEVLLSAYEKRKSFQQATKDMSILPTEHSLFDNSQIRSDDYDGSKPLALPKMRLQYLSVGDFLWRSLVLYRGESFHGVRESILAALRRLKPEVGKNGGVWFGGQSKMALPVSKPTILEVAPPKIGEVDPSTVKVELSLEFRRVPGHVRRDWDALRPDDVVFLLHVVPPAERSLTNGRSGELTAAEKHGIVTVRAAEVIQITDDKGKPIRDSGGGFDGRRRIQLKLDPRTFSRDAAKAAAGKPDVYEGINLILRRHSRENNFKAVLESIRALTLSEVPLPSWLHEVFLGYGDPALATYRHMPNRAKSVDYRDTFLDWQHLIESLPGKIIEPSDDALGSFPPPYVLETVDRPPEPAEKPSKKRRRGAEPELIADVETLKVSTYKPPNNGPYPTDVPKLNTVRFTPAQTEAIMSGTQPGLTIIVGPPGTGKTDVATQIINNIYHNFPDQKTLLIAHSNQALNQLFAKIVALDIDERHLLRLGHGEEELRTEASFSKLGRVESIMENRDKFLLEVTKLAASMGAPGAHGNSAETAGYFNSVYVEPAWTRFSEVLTREDASAEEVVKAFPFHDFFLDAPQPLFPEDADRDAVVEIAQGCYRHISKIFTELEDIRPFEVLRRDKDKSNYLLTTKARIIAMTSTHAAMRRADIASLGFHYDNVVMEEAAQITEIENFLPLSMQKPTNGQVRLQRVVLCGDHFQNSPVIQNMAFRHYANMEQSLFSRLVRLGAPTISLDLQGRARPAIAALYQWRYPKLGNLPHVEADEEFQTANAGFKYDYQFVNVPDYHGKGESEPTPHFIQNLGEAEYAVAIYQYMRLLGYPAKKITILTTYAGQRALVMDVLGHRCAKHPAFGMPGAVATVDKYQGEQNDYIILSLTRTRKVGYLRDVRRMTVALSRARLGLYVLGRKEIFEACYELRPAFEQLLNRPDKLMLVTGELWPSKRILATEQEAGGAVEGEVVMEGVQHLGQYVFEMTKTKMREFEEKGEEMVVEEGGELDREVEEVAEDEEDELEQEQEEEKEADEEEGGDEKGEDEKV